MGAQTSGKTYARELASGKEADDARAYSLMVGIGTGALQYLVGGIRAFGHSGGYGEKIAGKASEALGGVVKQPVARSALNGIAKRMKEMGKEAFEEYVETTLEPVYRNLIYDEENKLELLSVEALENAFVGALTAGALNLILPESGVEGNWTIEEDAAFGGRRRRGNAELTDGQTDVDNALKRDIMGRENETIGDMVLSPKKDIPKAYSKHRPKYAKGQVEQVWENAKDAITGKVYDPTGREITWDRSRPRRGQWDMGHIPEQKYTDMHKRYMQGLMSKKAFLAWYRDPANYRPELPSTNRSHRYE